MEGGPAAGSDGLVDDLIDRLSQGGGKGLR